MRRLVLYLCTASVLAGAWWLYSNYDEAMGVVQQYVENGEFTTLEARYTPEQIMAAHRNELLVSSQHSFRDSGLKFHPYLMMEIKFTQNDKKSREGVLFWSLVDGEMVLNTETWEKTHGFEDAINAGASRKDFKLMHALAKNKGYSTLDQLQKELHVEKETLQSWISSSLAKHLVVQAGNELRLHFQDPNISVSPETKVSQWLVTKPYNDEQRAQRKYTTQQIHKIAAAAFGDDFKIRTTAEVFLPVYTIEVLNPDGSVRTSYWNALNGQRIQPKYLH